MDKFLAPKAQNLMEIGSMVLVPKFIAFNINNIEEINNLQNNYSYFEKIKSIMKNESIIIRPCVSIEDSSEHSFAGMLESYIYNSSDIDIFQKLKIIFNKTIEIMTSISSKTTYNFKASKVIITFIIQKFIKGSPSGVAFSHNPIDGTSEYIIESTNGLNISLLQGELTPDYYIIHRNKEIIKKELGSKKTISTFENGKITKKNNTLSQQFSLNNNQILKIIDNLLILENQYHYPIDVEWIFSEDKLYILQCRPITTIN